MNRQTLKNVADPRHRTGGYVLPHITLTGAIVIAVLFLAGIFTAKVVYDAQYFEQRYRATVPLPSTTVTLPKLPATYPAKAQILLGTYPAVGDQQNLGACAAWSTAWALSYEWRVTHPGSWLRFSPRCMYDHYSDSYNSGQDGGSWPDQDAEQFPMLGMAKFKAVPYPPYAIDVAEPTICHDTTYRSPVAFDSTPIGSNMGQGAVDFLRAGISRGYPVLVSLEVTPSYDAATQQAGKVWYVAGAGSRGGHENVAIAYDDSLPFPDGSVGGALLQNQWGTMFGLHGRIWVSYEFIRHNVFALEVPHLGTFAPLKPTTTARPTVRLHPTHILPHASGNGYDVHGVYTHDTGVNIAPLINYWGHKYKIWPVGLTAVLATESGINAQADHNWGGADVSEGISQFTDQTAIGYGVCSDHWSCKAWLDKPANSIYLAARYLSAIREIIGLRFPYIYHAYNQGPYAARVNILYPPQVYAAQAANNFRVNLGIVQRMYG